VVLFTTDVKTVSEAQANVGEAEIVEYLEYSGYQVLSAKPKANTISDWECKTYADGQYFRTIVHVSGNNIIGHENVGFENNHHGNHNDDNIIGHENVGL